MTTEQRFWAKVDQNGPGGCWLWTASLDRLVYGRFRAEGNAISAHRFSYALLVGELVPGLDLDHLCGVRRCVNPSHLEQVTHAENVRRGNTGIANRSKTHCKRDHEFTPENTRLDKRGSRTCLTCQKARNQARYPQRRAA